MTKTARTARRFTVQRGANGAWDTTNRWHVIDRQSGRAVTTEDDRQGARLAAEYYNTVHTDTDPKDLG